MIDIYAELIKNRDGKYAAFQSKLIPDLSTESIIGVRTPVLRKLAKEIRKDADYQTFLQNLPHIYFEENQLHAFVISTERDFDTAVALTRDFLPYINNWATCDQLSPKVLGKNRDKLLPYIDEWIKSSEVYTVRFGIGQLMRYYLDDGFKSAYLEKAASVKSDEYYVNMMKAWFFATALAKQYDETVQYIQDERLDKWTHNKTIQKAIESYRLSDENKAYLRKLKR